jgi:hypothetical protein
MVWFMKKIIDMTGLKFGRLTVIKYAGNENLNGKRKYCKWKCLCECGKEKIILRSNLITGSTQSCGCLKWPKGEAYILKTKQRLEKHTKKTNKCWFWTGALNAWGYGIINIKKKITLAHRAMWSLFKGEIPKNSLVCHSCDNPSCVNPDHLWLGSNKDNMDDMYSKKRSNQPQGEKHPLSKLTNEDVLKIRSLHKPRIYTAKQLAKEFNVKETAINCIIYNKTWKHLL